MGIMSKKNNIQKQEKELLRKLVLFYVSGKKDFGKTYNFMGTWLTKKVK